MVYDSGREESPCSFLFLFSGKKLRIVFTPKSVWIAVSCNRGPVEIRVSQNKLPEVQLRGRGLAVKVQSSRRSLNFALFTSVV